MKPDEQALALSELRMAVAQLRHLYTHVVNGRVSNHVALANGLIAPEVRRIEWVIKRLEKPVDEPEDLS